MSLSKLLKQSIKNNIPMPIWRPLSCARANIKSFYRWKSWKAENSGGNFECPYCHSAFSRFIPYVNQYDISVTADIVSGQSIDAYSCPRCLSHDRERSLYFFFQEKENSLKGKRVLHFAPEDNLFSFISSAACDEYICADLDPKTYAHLPGKLKKLDITNIDYPDESFDIVICNHIMEHIPDDLRAMSEVFRVLKKSGMAVLMVPIGAALKDTYEDPSKVTEEERAEAFGQLDHVRVYEEKSYIKRLEKAGFDVKCHTAKMDEADIEKYGINPREKIYLGLKR